jgi:hypothetical protein
MAADSGKTSATTPAPPPYALRGPDKPFSHLRVRVFANSDTFASRVHACMMGGLLTQFNPSQEAPQRETGLHHANISGDECYLH